MLNRVLEVCEENRYVSLSRGFLVIKHDEVELGTVPLDDIAIMLVSAQSATITKNVLNALAEKGCITVFCGKNYVPLSMVIPVAGHYLFAKIIKNQINASLPFKKKIWQQIIVKKIKNQALALCLCGKESEAKLIDKISAMVKSGDPDNREAYAARMYWRAMFGDYFLRNKDGGGLNTLLNYGYAIMRASMTRAICSNGLIPALGIHHDNNLNQFSLADDLFEIYRPIVDCIVFKLAGENSMELNPINKKVFAEALKIYVTSEHGRTPVFQSMQYLVDSYVRALESKKPIIELPEWKGNENGITIVE